MVLTSRAALLALLGALPVWLVGPSRPLAAATLVVLAVLALAATDALLAAPVRRLVLRRDGDRTCRQGEVAEVVLTVTHPGGRTLRALVRDAWSPSAGATPRAHRVVLPAGGSARLTTRLVPTRRGDRRPDRVTVRSLGPLGLGGRQGRHDVPWSVRVHPAFASRRHLPERVGRLALLDGRTAARTRGAGSEFDSLRDYVAGDDVRAIDWRATARRAEVLVRTWRPERDRRVLVVVDTGRVSAGRVGGAPRLDAALDAALLLAALADRAGDRVDVVVRDRELRAAVGGVRGAELLGALGDALAGVEPALVETDGRLLVAEALRRARQRCLVVLLTGLEPASVEDGLLPWLRPLTARHTVVLAAVADPAVAALRAGREDAPAVYAAAAAAAAQDRRAGVTARLRRLGVTVVDAEPDLLPPALADAYLGLKAAGRL